MTALPQMSAPEPRLEAAVEQRFAQQFAFLTEVDRLKSVLRANTLCDRSRPENSAEHSWHLTLFAMVLADEAPPEVDRQRVIEMLILHDLVEIDTGDVPIHAQSGPVHGSAAVQAAEMQAAERIFGLLPADQASRFMAIWREFEEGTTPTALFARALDRTQPVVQNLGSNGGTWKDYNVTFAQLEQRVGQKIARGAPRIWAYLRIKAARFFDLKA